MTKLRDQKKVDLSKAVILCPEGINGPEKKGVEVFIEEVFKRTGISLEITYQLREEKKPLIMIGSEVSAKELFIPYGNLLNNLEEPGDEGYKIVVEEKSFPHVLIYGKDARGVLYGVGKLLRKMSMKNNSIIVDSDLMISSTPHNSLRGHQLGYRPKTNAYDAWTKEIYEQYIRELALFGANSIEILPPRTDDDFTGPHLKVDPSDMMIFLSQVIHDYGLDVWVWYPNMANNYSDLETWAKELAEREEIFNKVPYIDAVFMPGGDPGDLEPNLLFSWAKRVAYLLRDYHPDAGFWLSPQCFKPTDDWLNSFYDHVRQEPDWLTGIVFAPWERESLPELRSVIPEKYPIRRYPDITHSLLCQYPVPDWDVAFAITLGRECINPRPMDQKLIHNNLGDYAIGSISYSEGINDDVNKFIWSDQDWDPDTPVKETLKDYSRFFIGEEFEEELSSGFLALERNFKGPLAINENIEITLKQWRMIELEAPDKVLNNYRFQMGLLRAYYDAYIKRRLIYETELEARAMEVLENTKSIGTWEAINQAERILLEATKRPVGKNYREKCEQLSDSLFENIGAQLTVKKHQAKSWIRGAFMDSIDEPLNNSPWILNQLEKIRKMEGEEEKIKQISSLVNRENPGPGGIYDNYGAPGNQKGRITRQEWEKDPGYLSHPMVTFVPHFLHGTDKGRIPLSWITNLVTLYNNPLLINYEQLDPYSNYTLKVTYTGHWAKKIRLEANDGYLIHDYIEVGGKSKPGAWGTGHQFEFNLPGEILEDGKLELKWVPYEGDRGVDVAELSLIRQKS